MSGLACKEHLSAWRSEKFKTNGRDRTRKLEASLEWGNMMQLLSVLELEFLCKLQMECAIEN